MTVGEYSGQYMWSTFSFLLFLPSAFNSYNLHHFLLNRFTCPSKYIGHKMLCKCTAPRDCWCPRKVCCIVGSCPLFVNLLSICSLPSVSCLRSSTKDLPYRIEWHTGKNKNDAEAIPSSITEISTFEPNDIMVCP
jgi:hypothetical protein